MPALPQVIATRTVSVDAGDIMKGQAADMRLEPGDIIYVPNAPSSTLKRYANMIVDYFATKVLANQGVAAGGGQVGGGRECAGLRAGITRRRK